MRNTIKKLAISKEKCQEMKKLQKNVNMLLNKLFVEKTKELLKAPVKYINPMCKSFSPPANPKDMFFMKRFNNLTIS